MKRLVDEELLRKALYVIDAWERDCDYSLYWRDRDDAITALRTALEQPAVEPVVEPVAEASVLELADQLKAGAAFPAYPPMPLREAASVLLKQQEEIVQLREALRVSAAAPQAKQEKS